jgi:hypothetical protein
LPPSPLSFQPFRASGQALTLHMSEPKAQPMYNLGKKSIAKPIMQKTIMMQEKTQKAKMYLSII